MWRFQIEICSEIFTPTHIQLIWVSLRHVPGWRSWSRLLLLCYFWQITLFICVSCLGLMYKYSNSMIFLNSPSASRLVRELYSSRLDWQRVRCVGKLSCKHLHILMIGSVWYPDYFIVAFVFVSVGHRKYISHLQFHGKGKNIIWELVQFYLRDCLFFHHFQLCISFGTDYCIGTAHKPTSAGVCWRSAHTLLHKIANNANT